MDLKDIVSISGKPGLFFIQAQRTDGIIVSALGEEKKTFVSNRQHLFTPLDNITIYTKDDSISLEDIFSDMKKDQNMQPPTDFSPDALKEYFRMLVPDYDDERVYVSDIKKIIKWYSELDQHDLVTIEEKKEEEEKSEEDAEAEVDEVENDTTEDEDEENLS